MVVLTDKCELGRKTQKGTYYSDVIAVIPAYNAEKTVGNVVKKVLRRVSTCLVIDDGSSDNTGDAAVKAGADLIVHVNNQGKGAALKTAFAYLKKESYQYAILLDADGQHEPGEISRFVQAAQRRRAHVVCGNRMSKPEGMPWLRRATNRFMSKIVSLLCGVKLSDTQCGYRLLSKRVVDKIQLRKANFEVDTEILFQSARKGFKFSEVTISTIYADDHSSHINPVRDTLRFIWLVLGLLIGRIRGAR